MTKEPKRVPTSNRRIVWYPKQKKYYARLKGGKERSLDTDDFKKAERRLEIMQSQKDPVLRANLRVKVKDVTPDYIQSRKNDVRDGRIRQSQFDKVMALLDGYLLPYFGKSSIAKIDSQDWEEFVRHTQAKTNVKDFSNLRAVFSHLMKWAAKKGYRDSLLILDIPKPKRRKRRILRPEEMAIILSNSHGYLRLFATLA